MKMVEDDRNRLMSDYIPSICQKNFAKKAAGFQGETKAAWYYELVQAPLLMADFAITERFKTIKQLTLGFRQKVFSLYNILGKRSQSCSPHLTAQLASRQVSSRFSHNLPPFPE